MNNASPEKEILFVEDELEYMEPVIDAIDAHFPHTTKSFTNPREAIPYINEFRDKIDLVISGMWFQGDGVYEGDRYGGQRMFNSVLKKEKIPTIFYTNSSPQKSKRLEHFLKRQKNNPHFDFLDKWTSISGLIERIEEIIETNTKKEE